MSTSMRFTLPALPGPHRRSHIVSVVLATLTVVGLLAMHGLSWGHDSGCRTAPSASSLYAAAGSGLAVNGGEHAPMLGVVPTTADPQTAARQTAVAQSSMTRIGDYLHVVFAEPQTLVTALTPAVPVHGSSASTLMCVAVLAGLAMLALLLALLLAASRRATSHSTSHLLTRSSGTTCRRTPHWAHLAPRLSVLCVSRT